MCFDFPTFVVALFCLLYLSFDVVPNLQRIEQKLAAVGAEIQRIQ